MAAADQPLPAPSSQRWGRCCRQRRSAVFPDVIGAYVGPYVWLGCVDAQLLLGLRLFLGSHGRARSCLRRPPAEVQRPQSDQRCGDRHPGPTTHPGRVSVNCAAAGSSPGWFLWSSGVRRPEARSRGGFHIPRLGPPPFHAPPVGRSCSGRGRLQDALWSAGSSGPCWAAIRLPSL
jgi:hypothetical protein